MTIDTQSVYDRLEEVARQKEAKAKKVEQQDRLTWLNSQFGRDREYMGNGLFNNSLLIARQLSIEIDTSIKTAAHKFFDTFQYMKWDNMSAVDIKMAGDLIAAIVHPHILYDERSFSFYYEGEDSASVVFDRLMDAYKNLSWWKQLITTKPAMIYPTHIGPSKLISKKEGS